MKRFIATLFLILGASTAWADELADAAKAVSAKDYPQALAIYTKLAHAGNPVATLRLGEMYWYAEGVPLDRAKGDALFAQAAAAGNEAAVAATGLSRQRQQRLADIAYWTSTYDGADLFPGKFGCAEPAFPKFSDNKRTILAVAAAAETYTACYNRFIDNVADAVPPGKRIPKEVALVMSEQEFNQAREHLTKVYKQVVARERIVADRMMAQRHAWMTETVINVKTQVTRRDFLLAEIQREREKINVFR
jgi:TPR repeat protein